jgi:hypothetical protein
MRSQGATFAIPNLSERSGMSPGNCLTNPAIGGIAGKNLKPSRPASFNPSIDRIWPDVLVETSCFHKPVYPSTQRVHSLSPSFHGGSPLQERISGSANCGNPTAR